ncbi:palmitoyl-acyl carrier protein thioesterase, chloroplastic-like [Lactuca sativa]|uniref:palmitoyl-acyl carrier protein thioesterase, chloroplastic-like n=1 Tax=Lactuca sativa TaxID=4236 RepID=UPI0022B073E7|nr:palmitoyl-acyl carrier protein thioesterase, chloroplastic-like [Lactuca sativa]
MDWSMVDPEKEVPNMVLDLGVERMIQDGLIFQEKFCIRIYEVGPDQKASVETLMNHLLETSINHMKKTGFIHEGLGSEEMSKYNLTWVVAKIQMVVDHYPKWYNTH